MAQRIDDLGPEDSKRFMHHYNFPPFSTGETGRVGNPSRRSIGHGMLGERAMAAILPPFEEFPYTIRLVLRGARLQRLDLKWLRSAPRSSR